MSSKKIYRPHSWSQYNKSLVNRGSLTLWISPEVIEGWYAIDQTGRKGASNRYSDLSILCASQVRFLYQLSLRATQGFIFSIFRLLNLKKTVPCYTTLCRRLKLLSVPLLSSTKTNRPKHIVLDSSGLKVYGEGEWKVRQHGSSKRRTWRKIHLGFDSKTQEIICAALTTNDFKDSDVLEDCLSQIPSKGISTLSADGAYDTLSCYDYCENNSIKPLIPPRKGAKIWKPREMEFAHPRDVALRWIRRHGRKHWRLNSGYSIRSLAETGMFRLKQLLSDRLSSRNFESQANEAFIKCSILNKFTQIGLPNTRIA